MWFAEVETRVAADQERTADFETPTEGHAVHGLSAGVRLPSGDRTHALTLRVDNATDVEYRSHTSRIKDIMPESGRNVSLLYRFSF